MKYHIVTLGCPKNTVDSEGMSSLLMTQGHTLVPHSADADVIIVNTCSFIAAARDETLGALRAISEHKAPGQRLIAAGCMAESHVTLVQALPGVDAVLSTREWVRIGGFFQSDAAPDVARNALPVLELTAAPAAPTVLTAPTVPSAGATPSATGYADWRTAQIRRTARGPSAYLKISDGCNLRCAFCTIPSFKGTMRSKPVGAVLGEAQELAAAGVREIVLVAQHLTDYGRDLHMEDGLALLLDELCAVLPPHVWLRLMYAYPHGISSRLITAMSSHQQICAYLDMPLQHAHSDTLRRMRRPPDTKRTRAVIHELRAAMPDIALRSTFIVGFPGETRREFDTLLAFLEEMELDRVGAFPYSHEPGTHAATLSRPVAPHIIERRWHTLMQFQQPISLQRNQRWVGRTIDVLIEGHGSTDDGRTLLVGRSFRDAPEVDGQVLAWGAADVGTIVPVRITEAAEYDLWGTVCGADSASLAGVPVGQGEQIRQGG